MMIDAFNIIPGIAFTGPDSQTHIAMKVERDHDRENVTIWARRPESADIAMVTRYEVNVFILDYSAPVALAGVCVNAEDFDDDNIGTGV